jgi:hypothetical protein
MTASPKRALLKDGAITIDPYDHEAATQAMLRLADPAVAEAMGNSALALSKEATWQAVSRRITNSLFCKHNSVHVERSA